MQPLVWAIASVRFGLSPRANEQHRRGATGESKKRKIERTSTPTKRINNPPVGFVTPETDPPLPTHQIYDYIEPVPSVKPGKDLHYDPHLDPQLVWAGKKEHASFEVPDRLAARPRND
jgi:hypothetical protein